VTLYLILKYVHVLLAITAVGSNLTYGIWLSRAGRDPQHTGFILKTVKFLDDRVANPAYGLLLITGLAMLYVGGIRWTMPWVLSALVLYAVVVAVAAVLYTPALASQIAAAEAAGPQAPVYQALAARGQRLGIVVAVLILVIVFLMVTKPALWG
jgi:uncharacterized membrane protein